MAILLILLGLSHGLWKDNALVYPLAAGATGCVSLVYALYEAGAPLGAVGSFFERLPLFDQGFGWLWAALLAIPVSLIGNAIQKRKCHA